MRIRTVRDDDFAVCAALDLSYDTEFAWQMEELHTDGAWGAHFREVRLPRVQHVVPDFPIELRLRAWERCDGFWIAVEHRQLWGYIAVVLELDHQQIRIVDFGVDLQHRRQGIGSELLAYVLEWGQRHAINQLIFECPLKAHPAISFAVKHRFSFCGFQDRYWPGQTAALFFRKRV